MQFFDDDSRLFEWRMGVVLTLIVLYMCSYITIRAYNTPTCESEGCYYEVVDIPQSGIWKIYSPIMA